MVTSKKIAIVVASAIACIVALMLIKPANDVKAKETTMSMIQQLADELVQPDIKVDQLISLIGTLSKKSGNEFIVAPRDKSISEASIGVTDMKIDAQVPNYYIELSFIPKNGPRLSALPTIFNQWRRIPANPEGNPWNYRCTHVLQGPQLQVTLFAELSGDADSPSTRILSLTLRRDKW